ncbi:hypothetical protein G647_00116 [Cladophialophora carrionii CBS 160.54]|uniref:Xylanolytic transcriptional activator regulatory domain-containing protein n=1 Tax=Cladophialophora carrionii CBS 160.54 TaxID=1279043 RepID=V9DNX9_9EURO|nr:uncharacterized protein G647_00116 [Cladophialophora carrionii CBS 160.54]ETI27667.1 hypothetical protein G647_00116 [Cladophialophora carrionii CBS 160.54]
MDASHRIPSPANGDAGVEETRPTKRPRLIPSIEVGFMRDGSGRDSASFVGSASGIHFIRSVYGALNARASSRNFPGETPESNIVPGEDDRLNTGPDSGPSKPLWQSHEVEWHAASPTTSITFDDLLDWTSSYFDVWHPPFPFLHAPSMLERFETLAHNGIAAVSPFDVTIIKAVVSIALADRRQTNTVSRPVPKALVFTSFEEALNSVHAVMSKPATLQALQAAVCVQLFLVSMLRLNAASRLGGLIIRVLFQLGLHRCPARFASFKAEEQQLRRRLFWSIYCIDRHICQALGLPLTIRDDDVDVCYPDNEIHTLQRSNGSTSRPDSPSPDASSQQDGRLRLLTLIAKHAEIRGLIMELRNKRVEYRAEGWDKAVLINAKLTQWWNQVEDSIEQAELHDTPLSDLHQTVLKVLKHESVISLNRPLLAASKTSANYAAALQSCISASKSIIKALNMVAHSVMPAYNPPDRTRNPHFPMFWPSFTWSIWMSAFIILYAALESEIDYNVAVRNTDRALHVLTTLAARGNVWPTACAVAIRDLRSTLDETRKEQSMGQTSAHQSGKRFALPASDRDDSVPAMHPSTAQPVSSASMSPPHVPTKGHSQQASSIHDVPASCETPALEANGAQTALYPDVMPGNSWLGLGIGMDLGTELPMFPNDGLDPLQGFDIPFWVGQDNYATWMGS